MKGAIMQPTYLSWLGYFELICSCDIFVIFDTAQFDRSHFDQRNRIKTSNGVVFLTVPVRHSKRETPIYKMKISNESFDFAPKHLKTIELAYKKAPYFEKYRSYFEKIYSNKYVLLRDLNVEIIKTMCEILGIKTKIIYSSDLNLRDENMGKTEKVINLCKKAGITHLYDAGSAEEILDKTLFKKENILLTFQNYKHPKYHQLWGGEFIPYLSAIDLIFNEGDSSLSIIKSGVNN